MILTKAEKMYFNVLEAKGKLKRSKEYPYKQDVKPVRLKSKIHENYAKIKNE